MSLRKSVKGVVCLGVLGLGLSLGQGAEAAVESYVTVDDEGYVFEYNQDNLIASIVEEAVTGDTPELYKHYSEETLIGVKDSINGYVDISDIIEEIIEKTINNERICVDTISESEGMSNLPLTTIKLRGEDGSIVKTIIINGDSIEEENSEDASEDKDKELDDSSSNSEDNLIIIDIY